MNDKWWNEKLGYIYWMDSEFNIVDTLERAMKMVDLADDQITTREFNSLLEEVHKHLSNANVRGLKRYIVDEFPFLYKKRKISSNTYLEWFKQGVKKVRYYDTGKREEYVLNVGFDLKQIYEAQETIYYKVQVGDLELIKTKSSLIDYIHNDTDYSNVAKNHLHNYISAILFQERTAKGIEAESLFPAVGIFADKDENLIVCYPGLDGKALQGTNGFQKRIIKLCEKRGLDIDGTLLDDYLKIINFSSIPEHIMLATLGYCITSPFFHVLKDALDLFPNFFWIAEPPGVGKTNHLETFFNFLFGTELKSNDDIDSPARLTQNTTAHTSSLVLDDVDKLKDECMSFIKGNSTRKKGRERLNKDQELSYEDTYASFVGSANSSYFLSGSKNDAFRDRCLIFYDFNIIDGNSKESIEYMNIYTKLKNGNVLAPFLLTQSIKFISIMIEGDIPTKMKLELYFKEKRRKISNYFKENFIQTANSRRITIYTLLFIGWEFWDHIFKGREMSCKLISNALDIHNNDSFKTLVEKCEDNISSISIAEFDNIIEFYELKNSDVESLRYPYEDTHNNVVLTTKFVNDYDKWARERGYTPLVSLQNLRELIIKLLKRPIEHKVYKVRNRRGIYQINCPCELSKRGVLFPFNEIKQKLGLDPAFEKSQKLERKVKTLLSENNMSAELDGVISVLEIDDFDRDYIKKEIEKLILNRIISQNNGRITLL